MIGHRSSHQASSNLACRKLVQNVAFAFVWLAAFLAVAALIWIIGYVMVQGVQETNLQFLTTRPMGSVTGEGGCLQPLSLLSIWWC